ncbi:MAG: hypothetical protein AB8I08_22685 [Sandaracinaceae bacterium]
MPDSDATKPPQPEPRWQRWAKRVAGVAFAILLTEFGAALVHFGATGAWFSVDRMRARRAALRAPTGAPERDASDAERRVQNFYPETRLELSEQAIHPYVGFVNDPSGHDWAARPPFAHAAHLFSGESDALRVLVVGGSVAGQVWDAGGQALVAALATGPFEGREVVVVSLAVGGYKQPQQLGQVAYLLSVGAQFDVLLNVDGFNEAVLPWAENAAAGVYPLYPRWWDLRLLGVDESEVMADVGAIRVYRDVRRSAAGSIEDSLLRHSVLANVLWDTFDRWAERRAYEHTRALRGRDRQRSYQALGPAVELDRDETLQLAADNWARSSTLLDRLSERSGFLYVHVLQPNQYLDGRKPLSDEEVRLYHHPDSPYGQVAADGYARLFAEAPRLAEAGVHYHDLTRLFEEDTRTLYMDDCCHFNQVGIDLLSTRIGELVVEDAESARSDP